MSAPVVAERRVIGLTRTESGDRNTRGPGAAACVLLASMLAACGGRSAARPADAGAAPAGRAHPAAASAPVSPSPSPGASPAPAPSPPPAPTPIDFTRDVVPIMEKKCTPCHFPGGRMYERMPFDKEVTIRARVDDIVPRLRDPEDQDIVRTFVYGPAPAIPSPRSESSESPAQAATPSASPSPAATPAPAAAP